MAELHVINELVIASTRWLGVNLLPNAGFLPPTFTAVFHTQDCNNRFPLIVGLILDHDPNHVRWVPRGLSLASVSLVKVNFSKEESLRLAMPHPSNSRKPDHEATLPPPVR